MIIRRRLKSALCLAAIVLIGASGCAGDGQGEGRTGTDQFADLADVQQFVFSPRCATAGCHDAITSADDLDLSDATTSFDELVEVGSNCADKPRIEPFDRAGSYLLDKLGAGAEPCGNMMPLGAPPLDDEDVEFIASWVDGGALPAGSRRGLARLFYQGNARSHPKPSPTSTTTSTSLQ